MKTKKDLSKTRQKTLKAKYEDAENKIKNFLRSMRGKITNKCPYKMNLLKDGSKSKNAAGLRVSENGNQLKEDFGQLFFYDLVDNAMRVPHWHSDGDEIGLVLDGKIRVTIWNGIENEKQVFTAERMGSWFIPKGTLHCLENLSSEKTSFLVCYNNPNCADRDFLDAWASTPNDILSASTYLSKEETNIISKQQLRGRLSKYEPTTHLSSKVNMYSPFSNNFHLTDPVYYSELGEIRRIDPKNTVNMKNMAWQKTILKPGSLRLPHWYTNANVILYVNKGSAFVSMLDSIGDGSQEKSYNFILEAGHVLALPVGFFHCLLNITDNDLEFYEAFMSGDTNEITLLRGIQSVSSDVASGSLGLSVEQSEKMLKRKAPEFIVKF
jgi:oxalate decarboxylase